MLTRPAKVPLEASFAFLCGYIQQLRGGMELLALAIDGKVDETREINGKALAEDLTLSQIEDISIPTSAWAVNADSTTKSLGYDYYADVAVTGLAASDSVSTDFSVASLSVAKAAGVANSAEILAGKMRYYTAYVPSGALTARLTIIKA